MVLNTYRAGLGYFTVAPGDYLRDTQLIMTFARKAKMMHAEVWVGYDFMSMLEGGMHFWLVRSKLAPLSLGQFYLHKHATQTMTQDDIRQLATLNDLKPVYAPGDSLKVERDLRNISWQEFNAYDMVLTLTVDE
jgi:succinate dehydrogenase/fumarate reductase flavoprotein subunit